MKFLQDKGQIERNMKRSHCFPFQESAGSQELSSQYSPSTKTGGPRQVTYSLRLRVLVCKGGTHPHGGL